MADGFHETPVRGKHLHNAGAPTETAVSVLPAIAGTVAPAYTEGNVVALSTDLEGNLRVVLGREAEDGALDVDVIDRQGRILGLNRTDADTRAYETTRTETQTAALVSEFDATQALLTSEFNETQTLLSTEFDETQTLLQTEFDATQALLTSEFNETQTLLTNEFNETQTLLQAEFTSSRTTATDGTSRAKPFVRGADVSDDNPLPVNIQTNPGTLVDSGLLTAVDVAPGATVTLDGGLIPGGITGRLVEITAASSVRIKVVLRAMGPGAADKRVWFVDPTSSSLTYQPVDRDAITAAATGRFRLSITNMDNLRTADVYGSVSHVEF